MRQHRSPVWLGLILATALAGVGGNARAVTWTNDADGLWSTGPWSGAVPNAVNAQADLIPAGLTALAADRTVTLDQNATIGRLWLQDPNHEYSNVRSWTVAQGGSYTITFDASGNGTGTAYLNVGKSGGNWGFAGPNNRINVPLILNDNLAVTNMQYNSGVFMGTYLNQPIADGAYGAKSLTLTHGSSYYQSTQDGIFLPVANTYSGGTILDRAIMVFAQHAQALSTGPITFGTSGTSYLVYDLVTTPNLVVSNNISGGGGATPSIIRLDKAGTVTFAGNNSGFAGTIWLNPANNYETQTIQFASSNPVGTATFIPRAYGGNANFVNQTGATLTVNANWGAHNGATHYVTFKGGDFLWTGNWNDASTVQWQVDPGLTVNLSGAIGSGRYNVGAGGGTLILSGTAPGTYGVEYVNGGSMLGIGADNVFGPASGMTRYNGNNDTTFAVGGPRTVNRNIQLAAYTETHNFTGSNDLTFIGTVAPWNQAWGPTLNVTNTGLTTFAGTVSGTIGVNGNDQRWTKTGPGTLVFGGSNTYNYRTRVTDGALRATDGAGLPSNSFLSLETTGVLETSGTFGRPLAAWPAGGVTGANTFRWLGGGFAAQGGALSVDVGNDGASNLVWNTANTFMTTGTMVLNSLTADNAVTLVDNLSLGASGTNTRTIQVLDNPNSAADKAVIAGQVTGSAGNTLAKTGAGTLELSANNSYLGPTAVNEGLLRINGNQAAATGAVGVASGATLGGTGTVGGLVTVASGGHLAPGASPGTLTLAGGLTLNSGAVLDFELGPVAYDQLLITGGTFTGSGGTGGALFNLSEYGYFSPGTYTLIDWLDATPLVDVDLADFVVGAGPDRYNYSFAIVGSELQLTAIPEPGALALLAAAGLLALGRRRR